MAWRYMCMLEDGARTFVVTVSLNLAEDVEPGGGGASAARLVAMTARLLALKKTAVVVPYPPSNFSAACDAMRAAGGFFVPRAA